MYDTTKGHNNLQTFIPIYEFIIEFLVARGGRVGFLFLLKKRLLLCEVNQCKTDY